MCSWKVNPFTGDLDYYEVSGESLPGVFAGKVTAPQLKVTTGAGANKVLVSDAAGDLTYQDPVPFASPTFTGTVTAPAIKVTTGAGAGKVLVSDADGDLSYAAPEALTFGGKVTVPSLKVTTGAGQGRILVSDSAGDLSYLAWNSGINHIGIPGGVGFGVGICPEGSLPPGMAPMAGCYELGHANYGNYQFSDGSIMCWIPKFFYRIAHASNPTYATYGVNSIDIKGADTYADEATANVAGYALHRAFWDGGVEKLGFFVDKYKCSKRALGTGYVASSIANALPLSSSVDHNPFSELTGGVNAYYSTIDLAHRRDGVDGAVNVSSIFFCSSQFVRGALAMLSLAHAQSSSSTTWCAWYHATYNYPKGCNNNALHDCDDATVVYTTDGYSNCGKTGSGSPFAITTHNGQACGVADLNGLMYEISIGTTCDGANFYAAKKATAMKTFTDGVAAATDHWGATGIAAMMEALTIPVITGNDGWIFFGNGANQVLGEDVSGNSWVLTGLGVPDTTDGLSAGGTNLFGKDGFYRNIANQLCLHAGAHWAHGANAGVWALGWSGGRSGSSASVGFRAACYPV